MRQLAENTLKLRENSRNHVLLSNLPSLGITVEMQVIKLHNTKHDFVSQELENQAMAEAETWREQQLQLQEQHALQNRAKQEVEAEVERYKQVRGDIISWNGNYRKFQTAMVVFFLRLDSNSWALWDVFSFLFHRSCSTWKMSTTVQKPLCRAESRTVKMKSKNSGIRSVHLWSWNASKYFVLVVLKGPRVIR